ncbi:RICIN domain-containing protein [Actinacidiphila acidipaludis]|uniref:RICIN domain-containing protein n=1 Tax=Actinacidiphila acidipaludis TaxID=2873382 RepID=A0ABS7Q648_9ACTN|nr:RICIN domain-containing protein [Streptomyces acidipaludis]MBY8878634.1 RICIN domain-containing protein [Streptomyces acidipaludis]
MAASTIEDDNFPTHEREEKQMRRALGTALGTLALLAGSSVMLGAQPAAASDSYLLKNVATGKCIQGSTTGKPVLVRMVTCDSSNAYQKWGRTQGHVALVFSGLATTCLGVPKESGDIPHDVVTVSCTTELPYNIYENTAVGSSYPIGNSSPICYIGHYASTDTVPYCYENSGNYTRWNWVSAP